MKMDIFIPEGKYDEILDILIRLNIKILSCSQALRGLVVGGQDIKNACEWSVVIFEIETSEDFSLKLKQALKDLGIIGQPWGYFYNKEQIYCENSGEAEDNDEH